MLYEFSRSEKLLGIKAMEALKKAAVAVFGIGGVGSFTVEALARCGVGNLILTDGDTVSITNINRQLIALHSTVGRKKTEVMKERLLDINPSLNVSIYDCFFCEETADMFDFSKYDYVVDAIDTVKSKVLLARKAAEANTKIISSMGTGNKLDPLMLEIEDIYNTEVCPLARVMRKELKEKGIEKLKVLYSKENPIKSAGIKPEAEIQTEDSENNGNELEDDLKNGRPSPGSVSFVPSVAGLIIAGEVIKDLVSGAYAPGRSLDKNI